MAVLAVEKKIIVIDIKVKVVSQIVIRFILSNVCFDIRISAQFIALDREGETQMKIVFVFPPQLSSKRLAPLSSTRLCRYTKKENTKVKLNALC